MHLHIFYIFLGKEAQFITCWSDDGHNSKENKTFLESVPDLGYFSDNFTSCSIHGFWILYDKINYNNDNRYVISI